MVDDWVSIVSFRTLPKAEAAKLLLEAAGMPVLLADAETVSMDWLLGNAIGYIKVQVPRPLVDRAVRLLEETESNKRSSPDDPGASDPAVCLTCGQTMADDDIACATCGWSYRGEPDDRDKTE